MRQWTAAMVTKTSPETPFTFYASAEHSLTVLGSGRTETNRAEE